MGEEEDPEQRSPLRGKYKRENERRVEGAGKEQDGAAVGEIEKLP
jgi:hypothetical protein